MDARVKPGHDAECVERPVTRTSLNVLALAQRNVAHGRGREQLLELDATVGQAVLVGVLQQRLDGRAVLIARCVPSRGMVARRSARCNNCPKSMR